MKMFRIFSIVFIIAIAFSLWTPAPAQAAAEYKATANNVAKLTVTNRTGGILYVRLEGTTPYWFTATKQGKNVFQITPGRYKITVTASNCGGSFVVKNRNIKKSATVGPLYCFRR